MTDHWPDDIDVSRRRSEMVTMQALGAAVCPHCFKAHPKCGHLHLRSPWSIAPRCTDCGEELRMPERQAGFTA